MQIRAEFTNLHHLKIIFLYSDIKIQMSDMYNNDVYI